MSIATIILEHPDSGDEVELTVNYDYTPSESPSLTNAFGCAEHYEIVEVQDQQGNYYADELVWTDDQVIEGIQHADSY